MRVLKVENPPLPSKGEEALRLLEHDGSQEEGYNDEWELLPP